MKSHDRKKKQVTFSFTFPPWRRLAGKTSVRIISTIRVCILCLLSLHQEKLVFDFYFLKFWIYSYFHSNFGSECSWNLFKTCIEERINCISDVLSRIRLCWPKFLHFWPVVWSDQTITPGKLQTNQAGSCTFSDIMKWTLKSKWETFMVQKVITLTSIRTERFPEMNSMNNSSEKQFRGLQGIRPLGYISTKVCYQFTCRERRVISFFSNWST